MKHKTCVLHDKRYAYHLQQRHVWCQVCSVHGEYSFHLGVGAVAFFTRYGGGEKCDTQLSTNEGGYYDM